MHHVGGKFQHEPVETEHLHLSGENNITAVFTVKRQTKLWGTIQKALLVLVESQQTVFLCSVLSGLTCTLLSLNSCDLQLEAMTAPVVTLSSHV